MPRTTLEVPVIVTVTVEIDGETKRIVSARPDWDGGPWPGSADPTAYDPNAEIWLDEMESEEDRDLAMSAYVFAYDRFTHVFD